ncbi:hypothetical protein ACQI4F_22260 [Mycolicibacterium vaccae]
MRTKLTGRERRTIRNRRGRGAARTASGVPKLPLWECGIGTAWK